MSLILLKIGIVLLPFYELLARLFPYATVHTPDTRIAKSFIGIWISLAIGVFAFYSGEIRKCTNIWILFFLLFIPLNIHMAPQYHFNINGVDSPNYWVWKPFVMYLSYFIMFMYVQSLNITKDIINDIFSTMVWCGFIMSVYVIVQNLGWEQFFDIRLGDSFRSVTKPATVGTLGNSTLISPFIAMIIPIALYLKRITCTIPYHNRPIFTISSWIVVPTLIYAVIASQSNMAIGAMVVSLIFYSCLRWKMRAVFAIYLALMLSFSVLNGMRHLNPQKFNAIKTQLTTTSGRVKVWKDIIRISKEEKLGSSVKTRHPFTGTGIGSYQVLIQKLTETIFGQAHNDYLQILVTMGMGGLVLFLMSILYMLRSAMYAFIDEFNKPEIIALFCSFLCISLAAGGTFVWQIAPIIFLTVIIVGLLHNRSILKGDLQCTLSQSI